jgi:hypothetical protein
MDIEIHFSLTSALVGGESSASRSDRFIGGERTLGTHWIGGWVGLGTGLDDVEKGNRTNLLKSSSSHN